MSRHRDSTLRRRLGGGALAAAATLLAVAAGAQETTGDAVRGEAYFTDVYKCYACHGYDAQTGARRLLPTRYTEEGFITFVQNSPLPQMPAYNDVPAEDLADVYAYLRTLPADAPEVDEIALLNELMERKLDAIGE